MFDRSSWPVRALARMGSLLTVLLLATASLALGQAAPTPASVSGRVLDAATGKPLADVQVTAGLSAVAVSDSTGAYTIGGLAAGRVEVRFRRIGFASVTRVADLTARGATHVDAALAAVVTQLEPVVVTATREARGIADVAAAVSVADSTAIKQGRSSGLHEVLRYTPGVQATSRYGLDDVNLSIRGSGIRTTFGVRGVAVLVDGVPLTEPDGLTRLDLIELASARQVEVVRGPASAIYGGTASGGAINIISRSGVESSGLTLRAQRGSFDFEKYDGSLGATFGDGRGSVFVSGAATHSSGFRIANANDMTRFNLRSDYRLDEKTRLGLDASTSNLNMRIPGALNLGEYNDDPYAAAPVNITNRYARRDERFRAGLRLDRRVDAGRPIETTTYFYYGGRTLDHPIYQVLDQNLHRVQLGGRVRLPVDAAIDPVVRLTVGADYDNLFGTDRRSVNQGGVAGARRANGYLSLPSLGVFAQSEARLGKRWTLTSGLRYDRVRYDIDDYLNPALSSNREFEQLSPKGTLSYRVNQGTSAYVSVARGFEVPTSGELTASPDPSQSLNTDLKPMTLVNYEIGLKTLVANRMFVDVALFRTNIRGEFISRSIPTSAGPRTVYENAGRSRHTGLEVGWTALLTPKLDLVGSYTLSDFILTEFAALTVNSAGATVLTDFDGKTLPGVARHRLGGELRARPIAGLTAGVGAEWQSRTYVENSNADEGTVYFTNFGSTTVNAVPFRSVSPFALVHLNASYAWRGATFFASVENVFDKRYVGNITINDGQGRFYSAGAGRYLAAGISVAMSGGSY